MTKFGYPVEVWQIEVGTTIKTFLNNASLRTETYSGELACYGQQGAGLANTSPLKDLQDAEYLVHVLQALPFALENA